MMKRMMYLAAAVLMLAACNSNKTSKVVAEWNGDAPERVKFVIGDAETTGTVIDGKLEIEIPADVTVLTRAKAGSSIFSFVSDGSTLTLHPENGSVTSDKKNGIHSRYINHEKWMKDFINDYLAKINELGENTEEGKAYYAECKKQHDDFLKKAVKDNKDNIIALTALKSLDADDPKALLSMINSLSSKMKANPDVVKLKANLEAEL